MTDPERDPQVTRRYAELEREEPPRALDDAILAAARREAEARPAPLVAPTARRRWYVPVAAAAVVLLSVVVTLQVQREQLDVETSPPAAPAPPDALRRPAAREPAAEPKAERDTRDVEQPLRLRREEDAPPRAAREARPAAQATPKPAPAAAAPVPAAPEPARQLSAPEAVPEKPFPGEGEPPRSVATPAGRAVAAPDPGRGARQVLERKESAASVADALSKRAEPFEPPERWLERIAALRRDGRHKEADEAYAEFRRRYPDYRIPDSLRNQVLPP